MTTAYSSNCLNEYTAVGTARPAYDANGNLVSDGIRTYTWDAMNRLASVSENGECVVTNMYDALSRRVVKATPQAVTRFFYDGWNIVKEIETPRAAKPTSRVTCGAKTFPRRRRARAAWADCCSWRKTGRRTPRRTTTTET